MTIEKNTMYRDKNDVTEPPPFSDSLLEKYHKLKHKLKHTRSPLEGLKHVYDYMDEYNKFVSTFTVCEKFCSHCCKIGVNMTSVEAYYIESVQGQTVSQGNVSSRSELTDCPFLKNNACSIYNARPFNCRTFHTVDHPKYCEQGVKHNTYGNSGMGYGSDILKYLSKEVRRLNMMRSSRDIREFFADI